MAKLLETKPSSSAEIVASIDDLLIEIIQRLPLKQTVQLRLVSKYWNSLILDPKLCLLRNRPAAGLIFECYINLNSQPDTHIIFLDKSISPSPLKDSWYQERCHIMHSCNGLVVYASYAGYTAKYYVLNPTTRKCITLPEVVFDNTNESLVRMYLAFDPSKSPHYKVVCVLRLIEDFLYFFEVYSSETGLWRKVGEPFKTDRCFSFSDGVYWNGAIHFINIISCEPLVSVYFNLDCDLTPKVFPTPPLNKYYTHGSIYYFGVSCDHLHFVEFIDIGRGSDQFIVQEMKRDYSEWFVKYKVIVPCVGVRNISKRFIVVRGKNDEDSFLVVAFGKMIQRYNFEQNTCETLCNFESATKSYLLRSWGLKSPFEYIESLCSV